MLIQLYRTVVGVLIRLSITIMLFNAAFFFTGVIMILGLKLERPTDINT